MEECHTITHRADAAQYRIIPHGFPGMDSNATDEWDNYTDLTNYGWWSDLAAVDNPGNFLKTNHLHRLPAWLDTLRLGSRQEAYTRGRFLGHLFPFAPARTTGCSVVSSSHPLPFSLLSLLLLLGRRH